MKRLIISLLCICSLTIFIVYPAGINSFLTPIVDVFAEREIFSLSFFRSPDGALWTMAGLTLILIAYVLYKIKSDDNEKNNTVL